MSDNNRDICDWVAKQINDAGLPVIWGSDFNMPPAMVKRELVADAVCASVVASDGSIPTCTSGKGTNIDFFIISNDIKLVEQQARVDPHTNTSPHRPVAS